MVADSITERRPKNLAIIWRERIWEESGHPSRESGHPSMGESGKGESGHPSMIGRMKNRTPIPILAILVSVTDSEIWVSRIPLYSCVFCAPF
jgi:hypothetical protein